VRPPLARERPLLKRERSRALPAIFGYAVCLASAKALNAGRRSFSWAARRAKSKV
jgi:hypothetical protein